MECDQELAAAPPFKCREEYVWVDGVYRPLTLKENARIKSGRKSLKTNGNSELVYIDHPDCIDTETGGYRKNRNRGTNFTPPKKKRK